MHKAGSPGGALWLRNAGGRRRRRSRCRAPMAPNMLLLCHTSEHVSNLVRLSQLPGQLHSYPKGLALAPIKGLRNKYIRSVAETLLALDALGGVAVLAWTSFDTGHTYPDTLGTPFWSQLLFQSITGICFWRQRARRGSE